MIDVFTPKTLLHPRRVLERERLADYKSENFVGEIFATAGASRTHNLISNNVSASLTTQLRDRPCEVYANDMRVQKVTLEPPARLVLDGPR